MPRRGLRFNFPSMMHSSLRRVIAPITLLLFGCAHELGDYPEPLAADDAPVTGTGGSAGGAAVPSAGRANTTAGAAGTGGSATASSSGGGTASSSGGGGGRAPVVSNPPEGGAGGDDLGEPGGGASGGGGAPMGGTAPIGGVAGHGGGGLGGTGMAGSPANGGAGGGGDGGVCVGVPTWSAKDYMGGTKVQNGGKLYECKPHPFEGWCGLEAYEPGEGTWWEMAWTPLGGC